jgi:FkbH-like protein
VTILKVAVVSNINIQMISNMVSNFSEVYTPAGYGVWLQELLEESSKLYQFSPQAVFILLDAAELLQTRNTIEEVQEELDIVANYLVNVWTIHPDTDFYISDIDYPEKIIRPYHATTLEYEAENIWASLLAKMTKTHKNCHIFKCKKLVKEIGEIKFYSPKLWYLGGIKYSNAGAALIARQIEYIMQADTRRKKCVLLDLDNTLWGGVLGECGIEGIELSNVKEGARYYDFQRRLKEIKDTGVILGIVSKNNADDVQEVFKNHQHMLLKEQDFVIRKINWIDKADNIRQVAQELNIGLDSIVFVDDNPVEREAIKQLVPEVEVPDFPTDTTTLENFAIDLWHRYFFVCNVINEDIEKTRMYQENAQRSEALKYANNAEAFLRSLTTIIKIGQARQQDVERIAQLTQKTNQFNLTTKRYSSEDITAMMHSSKYKVFVAAVEDKFGDNGMVAIIILHIELHKVTMDSFLMSCRVMGRQIEDQLLEYVEKKMYQSGYSEMITNYFPTAKNMPVQELFERLGYDIVNIDEIGNKTYSVNLLEIPERVQYAQVIGMVGE